MSVPRTSESTNWIKASRWARYPIAVILLVLSILALIFRWYVEQTSVMEVGKETVVTTTLGAPTLTSTITLAVVLLITALLLPDLSELNVLGVGLKLKVEAAEKEAQSARGEARAAQNDLQELRVELVRSTATATAGASSESHLHLSLGETREMLREAIQQVVPGAAPVIGHTTSREALIGKVINGWEELRSILSLTQGLRVAINLNKDPEIGRRHEAKAHFVKDYELQMQAARDIRNIAAHPTSEIRESDLENGARLIEYLIGAAQLNIERYSLHASQG